MSAVKWFMVVMTFFINPDNGNQTYHWQLNLDKDFETFQSCTDWMEEHDVSGMCIQGKSLIDRGFEEIPKNDPVSAEEV